MNYITPILSLCKFAMQRVRRCRMVQVQPCHARAYYTLPMTAFRPADVILAHELSVRPITKWMLPRGTQHLVTELSLSSVSVSGMDCGTVYHSQFVTVAVETHFGKC